MVMIEFGEGLFVSLTQKLVDCKFRFLSCLGLDEF